MQVHPGYQQHPQGYQQAPPGYQQQPPMYQQPPPGYQQPGYQHPPGYQQPPPGYPHPQGYQPVPQQGYVQQGPPVYQQPQPAYYPPTQQPVLYQAPVTQGGFIPQGGLLFQQGGGIQFTDVMNTLDQYPAVYINQKFEWLESACGFETPNTYHVWAGNQQGDMTGERPLFRVKEKSSCCVRICLGPARPYELKCHQFTGIVTRNQNNYSDDKKLVMNMIRPCRCTFLCFQRPFLDIYITEKGQSKFVGKIVQPCYVCCTVGIEIYDAMNELRFIVEASICQAVFCCALPCKSCQKAKFIVYNHNKEQLTELWKESQGCFKACVGDQGDSFRVLFPQTATKEDKVLLMASAIFLDYSYFESNNSNNADSLM